jgi:outer membrane protein OmpA-like peptidoglycan-associated protein
VKSPAEVFVGVDYLHSSGFFVGGGLRGNLGFDSRSDYTNDAEDEGGDNWGGQFRLGFHPGVRGNVAPPPPPPPPAPAAPSNRPPTVKARCEPCVVQVGKSSTVTADANDPDGDQLTHKWTAPTGKFANPSDRQTIWTAPEQEGSVPVTVTVDDGKGGTATDTVTIQVIRPPVKEYKFEDVHFDFDRYSLRTEATRVLDEAIKAMTDNPELNLEIEGHTCNIGTAEYNLALGERRAMSVRDYLVSRGVTVGRLRTVSYGEERPKHDNAREETRRLNRRAALVVRLK